jgi:hypothetical protein
VDRFDMPAPTMTPELKRDLQLLKVIDSFAFVVVLGSIVLTLF